MKNATIETVAKKAGVSVGTVSRYLNGFKIRQNNKEAIEKVIQDLDFKVNQQARGLKLHKSFTIALLFPNISDVFATQVIDGVEEICDYHNYSVMICSSRDEIKVEKNRVSFINDKRVDGAIIMPISNRSLESIQSFSKEIPYVVIDKKVENLSADYVICENRKGSYLGVKELIDAGHSKISIIGGPEDVYTSQQRLSGYKDALKEAQIELVDEYMQRGEYKKNGGLYAIKQLMSLDNPPTAVFATNFEITMSVIKYCMSTGLKIGEDISIMGYDNIDVFQMLTPSISTVEQPMKDIGIAAAKILFKKINGQEGGEFIQETLPTNVVHGTSICRLK